MRRPNKPHVDGYENEEDCEGYYEPDEAERRGCHHTMSKSPSDPCQKCIDNYRTQDQARRQAAWDAKSPEEKAKMKELIRDLKVLY